MAWINVLGGVAVLGSYAQGLLNHPDIGNRLWGEVPEAIRPFYVGCMFLAAAGYMIFTYYLFFRVDPKTARIGGRFGFGVYNILYLVILFPSTLWMPLTFRMLENPSSALWLVIRLVLWSVGLGSIGLVGALLSLRPRQPQRTYWLATIGSIAFTIQTGLLDAIIWVVYFPA
jgi:hypothetical protein